MDNLTHTLVGLVIGASVAQATRSGASGLAPATRRSLLMASAVVGSNLPDLDLLQTFDGLERSKLAYLLQHRGYTHTLIGCVLLALLLYACTLLWLRYRRLQPLPADRRALATTAVLASFLHLGMDSLNSYGVHPFWPLDNRWYYGDSVFIIEPLYWLAAAPLLFVLRSLAARSFVVLVMLLSLAANVALHLSQPAWIASVTLATAALLLVAKRGAGPAVITSAVAMLLLTAVFVTAGRAAARQVEALAAASFPLDTTLDAVLTPLPTSPFCWDVLLLQRGAGRYTSKHGIIATGSLAAADCPSTLRPKATTAQLTTVAAPPSRTIEWLGEFAMPDDRLGALAAADCEARELLQFARAPFAVERDGHWTLGDLRYDREAGAGLSEIQLHGAPCRYRVPWIAPRAAELRP